MFLFLITFLLVLVMKYTFIFLNFPTYLILNCLLIFGLIKAIDKLAEKMDKL